MPISSLQSVPTEAATPAASLPKSGPRIFGYFITLIFILALSAFVIAESGVVTVPVFSSWYIEPSPSRIVHAEALDLEVFSDRLIQRLQTQIVQRAPLPYAVSASEAELNGILQTAGRSWLQERGWTSEQLQAVVSPEQIEIFAVLERRGIHGVTRLRFIPLVDQGTLHFKLVDVQLGDIPVHPSLAEWLIRFLSGRDLSNANIRFDTIRLWAVNLQNGELSFIVTPDTP